MKTPIKIKDIAEKACVSTGTVDRVLHNRGDVSEETRKKVLKIIDELGYKTNIIAKSLALKKKIVFSALIPAEDKYSSYWKKPLQGIKNAEEEFSKYGVQINTFLFDLTDKRSFIKQSALLLEASPDAVVIAPVFKKECLGFTAELKKKNIPFVFLDTDLETETEKIGYIGHNSYQSGKVAAKLIETRIGNDDNILLVNLSANPDNQNHLSQRSNGFRDFFIDKNRKGMLMEIDINNLNPDSVNEKLSHVFNSISNIKAIFVTSSKSHIIAKYLFERDLYQKIILAGYDLTDQNIEYLNNNTIDYIISQKPEAQGFKSIQVLFQAVVLKETPKKDTFMPIDIVIKENLMYY
ncbi:MAG: transcriptional regulator [Flavobacteriia bacterium]|nr:MAG: transcriptional regulator [Flavobacteriia bacterium]